MPKIAKTDFYIHFTDDEGNQLTDYVPKGTAFDDLPPHLQAEVKTGYHLWLETETAPEYPSLESMKVADLRQLAADIGVENAHNMRKSTVIEAIEAHYAAQ